MANSTKFGKIALTTLVALSGTLLADGYGSGDMRTQLDESTQQNISGTWGGKNPSYLQANGPFIAAEFLYWRADEDGLAYAANTRVSPDLTSYNAKDLDIHGEWKPGTRVAVGYLFDNFDQWDLTLGWTYFYDKANQRREGSTFPTGVAITSAPSHQLIPHWFAALGPTASSAEAHWNVHFNTVDLEVGRNYFISKNISLRPHMGVRGVWIDQDYKAKYNGVWTVLIIPTASLPVAEFLENHTKFKGDLDYKGAGLVTGADLLWRFTPNWGFFGRVGGSLTYGRFDVKERFNGFRPNVGAVLTPVDVTVKRAFNRVRANLETAAGFQWEKGLYNDKYHISFRACYELSEWFQQNELFEIAFSHDSRLVAEIGSTLLTSDDDIITIVPSHGDLSFQGLTLHADFNF